MVEQRAAALLRVGVGDVGLEPDLGQQVAHETRVGNQVQRALDARSYEQPVEFRHPSLARDREDAGGQESTSLAGPRFDAEVEL